MVDLILSSGASKQSNRRGGGWILLTSEDQHNITGSNQDLVQSHFIHSSRS